MQGRQILRRTLRNDCNGERVQYGLDGGGPRSAEAGRDLSGVLQERNRFLVFDVGDQPAAGVDRLAVLLHGNADDAGQPLGGTLLGTQR